MTDEPFSPEAVEDRTRAWLDRNVRAGVAAARRTPERRFADDGTPLRMGQEYFLTLQRKLKVLRWLDVLQFESLIDVGSGIEWYPALVGRRYGVPAYYSDFVHTMNLPTGGGLGRLDHAVTMNVARLPFVDGAFDVVLSSEVLEHLVRPLEAIAELSRIARRYVVLTSLEALSVSRWRRFLSHHRVDSRQPHVERNFFLLPEAHALFGPGTHTENLEDDTALPSSGFAPASVREAAYAALTDRERLVDALVRAVARPGHGAGTLGLLVVKAQDGRVPAAPDPASDSVCARWLLETSAALEKRAFERLAGTVDDQAPATDKERPVADELLARLCCPDCRAALARRPGGLECSGCGRRFETDYGVPILYPGEVSDDGGVAAAARLAAGDPERRRVLERLARRLRRNERPPSGARRAAWRLEDWLGLG